eukprot:TRINITY_DN8442_c0_g3_i1.p1 TRINITY_DN8442_c0_g3~~TRINITY_DN8442_c0_g3_i1.p1  ORF type:complete len:234 (+),score=26.43 TRINITY_DN8442_c0_g3_i1:536-1237(+)
MLADSKVYASVLSEHGESRARLNSFIIFAGRWQWLCPDIIKQTVAHLGSLSFSIPDSVYEEAANAGFMVLRMRKVSRGRPLVPTCSSCTTPSSTQTVVAGTAWETSNGAFMLHIYLQALLQFCNKDPNVIFSTLDGKRVASFQAVVQRSSWPGLWDVLEPLLGQHKSAYRLKYGGSGAPSLSIDVPPIFEDDAAMSDSEDGTSGEEYTYLIKNTFLHAPASDEDVLSEGYQSA